MNFCLRFLLVFDKTVCLRIWKRIRNLELRIRIQIGSFSEQVSWKSFMSLPNNSSGGRYHRVTTRLVYLHKFGKYRTRFHVKLSNFKDIVSYFFWIIFQLLVILPYDALHAVHRGILLISTYYYFLVTKLGVLLMNKKLYHTSFQITVAKLLLNKLLYFP